MKYLAVFNMVFVALFSISANAANYVLTFENGGTADQTLQVGDIVNLSLDSPDLNQTIWGNIKIEFDPAKLAVRYVDESYNFYGFWTYWLAAPGDATICGGGTPYFYLTGVGSDRADAYAAAYGEGVAGPSAYLDNVTGAIRFYHANYLYTAFYEPLRIGFEVLQTGPTTVTVHSQTEIGYDWCDFDTVVPTGFTFGIL